MESYKDNEFSNLDFPSLLSDSAKLGIAYLDWKKCTQLSNTQMTIDIAKLNNERQKRTDDAVEKDPLKAKLSTEYQERQHAAESAHEKASAEATKVRNDSYGSMALKTGVGVLAAGAGLWGGSKAYSNYKSTNESWCSNISKKVDDRIDRARERLLKKNHKEEEITKEIIDEEVKKIKEEEKEEKQGSYCRVM